MICKKTVSVLLCMLLLIAAALPAALAADPDSAVVSLLFANGDTIRPFLQMEVKDGTAEKYGFSPAANDHAGQAVTTVSALDVLVAAHAAFYGDAFTGSTASQYLTLNYGFASIAFGLESNFGFFQNGATPHDDVLVTSDWGSYYTGYALDTTRVKTGDVITFFTYTDTANWSDLCGNWDPQSVQTPAGKGVTLYARGYSAMSYGCSPQSLIDENTIPLAGAQISLTQDFKTYTKMGTLGEDGKATLTIQQPGTWYVVANGTVKGAPVIPAVCTIQATESETDPDVENARWFPIGLRPILQMKFGSLNDCDGPSLTIGFRLRLLDRNGKAADRYCTYALVFTVACGRIRMYRIADTIR